MKKDDGLFFWKTFLLAGLEGFVKRNEKESERGREQILLLIESSERPEMTHERVLCHIIKSCVIFQTDKYFSH